MMMVNVKHTSTLERIDEEDELFSEKMEETENDIDIDIVDNIPDVTKAYKEKPYNNSNKEPFGLTLTLVNAGYFFEEIMQGGGRKHQPPKKSPL